jgi:hypothetical protein
MHKLCKSRVISHLSASPDRLLYDIENSFEIIVKVVYRCCLRASREVIAFILTEWVVQTGKSKDDRRCTLSTDELSTPAGQPALSVRPHRSRLQRPCDGCRKAKQACVVPVQENPCIRCSDRKSLCTFRLPSSNRHRRSARIVEVSIETDENDGIEHARNNSQIPEVPETHVSGGSSVFAVNRQSHDSDSYVSR